MREEGEKEGEGGGRERGKLILHMDVFAYDGRPPPAVPGQTARGQPCLHQEW